MTKAQRSSPSDRKEGKTRDYMRLLGFTSKMFRGGKAILYIDTRCTPERSVFSDQFTSENISDWVQILQVDKIL